MRIHKIVSSLMLALSTFAMYPSSIDNQPPTIAPSTAPNACQSKMLERGYGMFIHFGMNTFIEKEWSEGVEPAATYNPTQLDPEQWVRTAYDAGFRYVLLVTKHHDGFCLWDSAVTDYDVASSGNTTDVVKAVSDACRKYGIGFGIYYSLWDRHEPSYNSDDFGDYLKFMDAQLTELLTNYGDICEIWFDGGWDKPASQWDIPHIYNLVKSLQPYCAVGVNNSALLAGDDPEEVVNYGTANPEDMTEQYRHNVQFRYFPMDFRLKDPYVASWDDCKIYNIKGDDYYLPFEHTICLSKKWNWFQKEQAMETRNIDELEELFYRMMANGNTLVVNIPPDKRGIMRQNEINALMELRQRVGLNNAGEKLEYNALKRPVSIGKACRASSEYDTEEYGAGMAFDGGVHRRWASAENVNPQNAAWLEVDLDPEKKFNRISIFEYMDEVTAPDGFSRQRANRITNYSIDAYNDGRWETIYTSTEPMGDCKVINFASPQQAEKLRLDIKHATKAPSIYELSVYPAD